MCICACVLGGMRGIKMDDTSDGVIQSANVNIMLKLCLSVSQPERSTWKLLDNKNRRRGGVGPADQIRLVGRVLKQDVVNAHAHTKMLFDLMRVLFT